MSGTTGRSPRPQPQFAPQPQRPLFNAPFLDVGSGGTFGGRTASRGPGGGGTSGPPGGPRDGNPGDDDDEAGNGLDVAGVSGEQRSDLIDFMTSRLLKVTIVAQPDLKTLLTHPALRALIRDIALKASQMATQEALNQMQEELRRMQQQMEKWMASSMIANISQAMDDELSPLAKNSAGYSLADLRRMKRRQITAYNSFAPEIGAPEIEDPHSLQDEVD